MAAAWKLFLTRKGFLHLRKYCKLNILTKQIAADDTDSMIGFVNCSLILDFVVNDDDVRDSAQGILHVRLVLYY